VSIKATTIESYVGNSQFDHVEEFHEHVDLWMSLLKSDFTKSEQIAFQRLILFSEKLPGVGYAKIGTMLKSLYEDRGELGMISRASFKRMIQKAIKFGIITVYETVRKNGSQSSNLYVFNRYPY
jgi:hypothetical protein